MLKTLQRYYYYKLNVQHRTFNGASLVGTLVVYQHAWLSYALTTVVFYTLQNIYIYVHSIYIYMCVCVCVRH